MARRPISREPRDRGNFISEWFGHRVYPTVRDTDLSQHSQRNGYCPFLSAARNDDQPCFKSAASRGVCTISSVSGNQRQDWLACPYRVLSPELLNAAVRRLFQIEVAAALLIIPSIRLADEAVRGEVEQRLRRQERIFVYFDDKLGGELSIPKTDNSPEFSFDVTIVEIHLDNGRPHLGSFAVLEIQTADFHGSYRNATRNLTDGLRLHRNFGATLQDNQQWLSEGVEGPNISNVFKRTFYQMMFKFQLGLHERCAGCVLAIPASVWHSWQRHLASPVLVDEGDGTHSLFQPGTVRPDRVPAWIIVFGLDSQSETTPSPLTFERIIATDAASMSHYALDLAPQASLANIATDAGLFGQLHRRVNGLWPALAATIRFDP